MARRINEYTADLVAKQPDRFGGFATLPLPDIEGALVEAEYALGTLHADGVVLMASYTGKYLGDPAFEPLWAELDRRHAVVFEHPGDTPGQPLIPPAAGVAPAMANFPFETTRTAIQLVLNGVVDRYPGLRIILSHAGGFLLYGSLRFAELARVFNPAAPSPMPSWPASAASTSTRPSPQAPGCPPSRHSPALATSCSAPTPLRPRRRRRLHRRAGRLRQPDRRRPGLDQPPQRPGPVPALCPATRSSYWPATTVTRRTGPALRVRPLGHGLAGSPAREQPTAPLAAWPGGRMANISNAAAVLRPTPLAAPRTGGHSPGDAGSADSWPQPLARLQGSVPR